MEKKYIRMNNRFDLMYKVLFWDVFTEWPDNHETSFVKLFCNRLKKTGLYNKKVDIENMVKSIALDFINSLSMQSFVCLKEFMDKVGFDFALKNWDINLKNIKTEIDIDGKEKTAIKLIIEAK